MIKVLIRRAACVLVMVYLATSVLADSNHPDLENSQVITLDVAAIERDAQDGNPFELVLGDKRLSVVLTPNPIWPEEGLTIVEVQRDGTTTTRVVKGNITYAGEVVGEDPKTGEARFTIAGGVLQGSVRSSEGWWFIEPLVRFNPKADTSQYLVYEASQARVAASFGGDEVLSDVVNDPTPPFTCPAPDNRISVAMVADREYFELQDPFTYWQRHTILVNEISGLYQAQFNKKLRLGMSMVDSNGIFLQSNDPGELLGELDDLVRPWLNGVKDLCSHLVHLTTAKDLEDHDGVIVLGKAHRPGYTSLTQQAVGSNEFLYYQNYMVASHEIGHNFDAVHEEADRWCAPIPNDPFHCKWTRTLDWEAFYVTNLPRFSDGTINPCHNNEQRIKVEMAERHLWP